MGMFFTFISMGIAKKQMEYLYWFLPDSTWHTFFSICECTEVLF